MGRNTPVISSVSVTDEFDEMAEMSNDDIDN